MLNGWWADKAVPEANQYGSTLDLLQRLSKVNARPTLFITANTDVIPIEVYITPLVKALKY